jgi:Tfp pilus assembly protein PilV
MEGTIPLNQRAEKGLSMIEVMFAFALLGFILIILFSLFPTTIMAVRHAEHRLKAITIAQSLLEEKRAGSFSSLAATAALADVIDPDDGIAFHRDYETFSVPGGSPQNVVGIRIKVSWKEKDRDYSVKKEQYVSIIQ